MVVSDPSPMLETPLNCGGSPSNATESTTPSTLLTSLSPSTAHHVHGELVRTAPSTPCSPGVQHSLFGSGCTMGGGDSGRMSEGLGIGRLCPSMSPLRVPSQRATTAARQTSNPLGSPVRLHQRRNAQTSGTRRPLVRAAPPPFPLWQYSPPPLNTGRLNSDRLAAVLDRPTPRPPPSRSSNSPSGDVEDDFPTTVARVILAAIQDAVNEGLGVEPTGGELLFRGLPTPLLSLGMDGSHEYREGFTSQEATAISASAAAQSSSRLSTPALSTVPTTTNEPYSADEPRASESLDGESDNAQLPKGGSATLAIVSLDPSLLADIPTFNPHRPPPTNFDLVMGLGYIRDWPAVGVSKTELKRIIKACHACNRFMYADRRAQHRCDAPSPDVHVPNFNLVQTMLSFEEHSGFSLDDLVFLLFRCQTCLRIFSVTTDNGTLDPATSAWTVHDCKDSGSA